MPFSRNYLSERIKSFNRGESCIYFAILVFLILLSLVLGFAGFFPKGRHFGLLCFFGAIIGIFTFVSLGADGSITVGFLDVSGSAVPITQSIYPTYYIPVFVTIMDFLLTVVKAVI
jgi:hypothetical protein